MQDQENDKRWKKQLSQKTEAKKDLLKKQIKKMLFKINEVCAGKLITQLENQMQVKT